MNFALPRLIGVVPVSLNHQKFSVYKSKFWQFTSVMIASTFIVCYPIALRKIYAEREVHTAGIWLIVEILQYTTTYLLTAYIYFVNILFVDEVIEYINHNLHYFFVYEQRLMPIANEQSPLLFQYVFRTIYSYFGFIYSNYIRLAFFYGRPDDIYTIIYYLPDIVITSSAIRFFTSIITQLTCYRRLNEIARGCTEMANATVAKSQYERETLFCEISDRIDLLCEHHCRLQSIARATERLLSKILIFSTFYAFANLVSCVSLVPLAQVK